MRRKSICFITHELIVGGLENVLIEAIKALHDKYDIEVISLFGGAEKAVTDAFPSNVNVRCGPFLKNNIIDKTINRLKCKPYLAGIYFDRVIKRKFDYIISLKGLERFACFSAKGKYKIYWCHNDFHTKFKETPLSEALKKEKKQMELLYKNHTMVWSVNEIISSELKSMFPSGNFFALTNPINCNEILKKAEEPCDITFDKTKKNIVMLGRISAEKGFGRLVRIMSQGIFEKFPDTHIYIIGGGEQKEAFEKKVIELGLGDKISLLGSKTNPYPYLKQADLLVSPSAYESFGLVVMEAMLLKIPVIASDTTGARYVTQNGKYAYCVENTNDALGKSVETFLAAPESYPYSKEEAYNWVWQHDTSNFAKRLIELLCKCEDEGKI